MSTVAIAARPHGGGGDATLGTHDLVLIDSGGMLHNYWSDLTRVCICLTLTIRRNSHPCFRHLLYLQQHSLIGNSRFGMLFKMLRLPP
jgi:hypothetical protein